MTFAPPSPEAQLAALRDLAAELPAISTERAIVERTLEILAGLLPSRSLCVRVIDLRAREPARIYARGAALRDGVVHDPVSITPGALERAKLKSAVAASARLHLRAPLRSWSPSGRRPRERGASHPVGRDPS